MDPKKDNKPRVLVVDDKQPNRMLIREYLDELDLEFEEAASGKECLGLLEISSFSLIVMDVQMPEMDGFAVLEEIRKRPELSGTPVIMVSAIFDSDIYIQKGIEAGALDFLTKPINVSVLQSKVKNFINLYEKQVKLDNLVNKLETTNQRLRESEQKIRGITQTANDAIILLKHNYVVSYWNKAAERIFGYNRFEVIANDFFSNLIAEDVRSELIKTFVGLIQQDKKQVSQVFRSKGRKKNGEDFPIELSVAHHINTQKENAFTVIIRDITHRVKMQKEAQAAMELRQTNKVMREFIDKVSHELRTPMNAIMGISNMLLKYNAENLTGKQEEGLQIINQSGTRLLEFINDILDLSKLESRQAGINNERMEIDSLLANMKSMSLSLIGQKPVKFHINRSKNVPEIVYTDVKKLTQILTNLLSNSIKFTEQGKINLFIHRLEDKLYFEVSDTGIGISKENQEIVFEKFRQIDNSASKAYKGTGLGLHITQELINLMKGTIEIESALNEGTTMRFYIPVKFDTTDRTKESGEEDIVKRSIDQEDPGRKIAVLIDDERPRIFWLTNLLQQTGFRVITFGNPMEGIAGIKTWLPDLIILKMEMPKYHGSHIIKELASHPGLNAIPIIASTNQAAFPGSAPPLHVSVLTSPFTEKEIAPLLKKLFTQPGESQKGKSLIVYEKADSRRQNRGDNRLIYKNASPEAALSVILRYNPGVLILEGLYTKGPNRQLLDKLYEANLPDSMKILVSTHEENTEIPDKMTEKLSLTFIKPARNGSLRNLL